MKSLRSGPFNQTAPQQPGSYLGFPKSLLGFLRCPEDLSELVLTAATQCSETAVTEGSLVCATCHRSFPIMGGIVTMLNPGSLDPEAQHEVRLRDASGGGKQCPTAHWTFLSKLEIPAHLAAIRPSPQSVLLELGCGTGRHTVLLAKRCRAILGVDFSRRSLETLARRLGPADNVGLVHADITRLSVAPRRFDRVFSTTSLDTREQRLVMHRVAAEAIRDEGIYVFSAEHYDLRSRLLGHPRLTRYNEGGILFTRLTPEEATREAVPYFRNIRCRPIQVVLPFLSRSKGPAAQIVSRMAEWLPVLRQLGNLVLVRAMRPLRSPEEGKPSGGIPALQRAYMRLHRD